jgi:hypothetical protein
MARDSWETISFSVIQMTNILGYSKKTGPLRKFKSVISDHSDSNVEQSIKNLFVMNTIVALTKK